MTKGEAYAVALMSIEYAIDMSTELGKEHHPALTRLHEAYAIMAVEGAVVAAEELSQDNATVTLGAPELGPQ